MYLLKECGLSLVEVKISRVSSVRGLLLASVRLPARTKILCVVRDGAPIMDLDTCFIYEGDVIVLVTDDEVGIRNLFTL